jgi:hypothetical protein
MINESTIIFTDLQPKARKARARRTDCVESHDAAKRVELGKAEQQRQWIYRMLKTWGPRTVPDLASFQFRWSTHELGKRIGEIEGIAPTGESRNGSRVWGIV